MVGKRFSKGLGGHWSLVPFGELDSGPNEDLGPEESVCFSGDQSAWECPPEDEFGMCGPEDPAISSLVWNEGDRTDRDSIGPTDGRPTDGQSRSVSQVVQAQVLPPEWAGGHWEGWGSTLHRQK